MTSPSDAFVFQLVPHMRCMDVIEKARAYVMEKIQGRPSLNYWPLFQSEAYQANRADLMAALAKGDDEATKVACRAWCKLVVVWTRQHPAPVVPLPPGPCKHEWCKLGQEMYCFRCDSYQAKEAA